MSDRGKGLTAVAVLVASALFAASASADVRYASPTGSGSACTHADPCGLGRAIEGGAVRFGDEVVVLGGTYDLGAEHVLVDRGIRVHGASGGAIPTIVSHDFTTLWVFHPAAVVSDLELVNSEAELASAVTVSDGILDRVRARSPATGCALFPDVVGQRPLIRNSFCWGSSPRGYGLQWGIGAGTEMSWTSRLRGVTAIGGLSGIRMDAGSGPVHLKLDAANVIVNGAIARDVVARAEPGGNTIRAVFSHSNYANKAGFAGDGSTVRITSPGAGANQRAAPLFRSAATGDFHERSTSPTVDHGIDTDLTGARDIDRQRRSQGPAPDIGGDELPAGA